jgi:poly(3-hydroxybutyrate) depolymerase
MLGLHGNGRTGLYYEVDTRFDQEPRSEDTIMVYPDGFDNSWAGPTYANATILEDLQFIHTMMAFIRSEYCVDSSRVYAAGKSNGGGFISSLACNDTVGNQFAAFAAVNGAFYTDLNGLGENCNPSRAVVPMIEFHGLVDETIAYEGGEGAGGTTPSIPDW